MPSEPPASQSSPVLSQSTRWALAFTVLSVIALRWAAWDAPTLRDEGLYGYIAQEVLRGYLPLETAIDNKGPVLFYQWALALSLGGLSSIEAIRALGTLFVVGSILVLFVLGRDLGGPRVGLWSAVLLAFHTSLAEMDGYYYATEFYTMLPCLVAAGLVWRGVQEGKGQLCAWAGVFLGLAVWTRLTSLTLLAAFGLFVLWMAPRSHKLRHSLNLALGLAAISLVFSAVYAVPGKLVVLYDAWVAFPSVQVLTRNAFVTEADQLWEVARVAVPQTVLLWFPALAAVLSGRLPSPQRHFVLLWLAMAAVGFWGTHLYLLKQVFLMAPPLCLLAAVQLDAWERQRRGAVLALVLLVAGATAAWSAPRYLALARGEPQANEPIILQAEKVASWVKANTEPTDLIYNWGVEWELYFRSERRSPTRQTNALLLVMIAVASEASPPAAELLERLQNEVVKDLEARPPEIMVLTAGLKNYDIARFTLPAHLEELLRRDYQLLFHEDPYWVFRRLEPGRQPPSPTPDGTPSLPGSPGVEGAAAPSWSGDDPAV